MWAREASLSCPTLKKSNKIDDEKAARASPASLPQLHHPDSNRHPSANMPLDTSTYSLALLRVDGRRWNELRRCHAQIRTQAAADGSSYWEMGNTKVMCVLTGPSEPGPKRAGTVSAGGGTTGSGNETTAEVVVNIVVAGFSSVDRRRRGRTDK